MTPSVAQRKCVSSRTRRFSPLDFSSFFGGLCRDLLVFSKCDTCHGSISNYIFYPVEVLGRKNNITKQILERSQNILIGKLPYHLVILDTKFVCPQHDFPYRYTNQTNKLGDGTNIHQILLLHLHPLCWGDVFSANLG